MKCLNCRTKFDVGDASSGWVHVVVEHDRLHPGSAKFNLCTDCNRRGTLVIFRQDRVTAFGAMKDGQEPLPSRLVNDDED